LRDDRYEKFKVRSERLSATEHACVLLGSPQVEGDRQPQEMTMDKEEARLNRQFDRIGRAVPASSGFLQWIRQPGSRLVRIPLGILLMLGGVFSFLPVLGVWMLPLGLFLLALDLPFLQGPINRTSFWVQRKWANWQRERRDRKAAKEAAKK
jgi:hypothetical protein